MFGFLNINKPAGMSSHDMVNMVRRGVGREVRVGHAGTLDPFASGVLVVCLGPATKLADYVQDQPKSYRSGITLGATSDTDDCTGQVTPNAAAQPPTMDAVQNAIQRFRGQIQQLPPSHSAVHVNGRRAYELARDGKTPDLKPRQVTIHRIEILRYEYPLLEIDVDCASGTYIRALARDIGQALGTGGHCQTLIRTRIGAFTLDTARRLKDVDLAKDLIPPQIILPGLSQVKLTSRQAAGIAYGKAVPLPDGMTSNEALLLDDTGLPIAIATADAAKGLLRPRKVFFGK